MSADLFSNGIKVNTGEYLLPPIKADLLSKLIHEKRFDPEEHSDLSIWLNSIRQSPLGIDSRHNPMFIEQAGWGVIFPQDCRPSIIQALRPLLNLRKDQAGKYYQEYQGALGYRPGDTKITWLQRSPRNQVSGPVEPEKVPYYLLIVGSPEQIPFHFQIQLDVQYAVGRISLDTPEMYAQYARSVVEAEQQRLRLPRRATFFGVSNPDDRATELSLEHLATPLAESYHDEHFFDPIPWKVEKVLKEAATKSTLWQILHGTGPPALLFTASHGVVFAKENPLLQYFQQGSLLCQDWPGPIRWGKRPIPQDFYFSAIDISPKAQIWGLIAFFFACYSAGTPRWDEFMEGPLSGSAEISPNPFIAHLPQRLLSHPNGGALAVIGHVDRAWGYSFYWQNAGRQLSTFENTFRLLEEGYPIGHAFQFFNERYAELSTDLGVVLQQSKYGNSPHPSELTQLWTANNDAKNYILLGDPAIRLMV